MHGKQLTALQRAEQRDYFGPSKAGHVEDLTWMADWRAIGLPYCSVYVVAPIDGWPCKIGISTNPMKRVSALQTASWKQLEVAWCCFVESVNVAKALERRSHDALTQQSLWLHGEWFDLRPDKAKELVAFEAALAGVETQEALPPGVALDFVRKLFESRYCSPSGMRGQVERRAAYLGLDR